MPNPYQKSYFLLTDIPDCECWNYQKKETATLEKNSKIFLERPFQEKSSTVLASIYESVSEDSPKFGIHVGGIITSTGKIGYRFIIPNEILEKSIGVKLPKNL